MHPAAPTLAFAAPCHAERSDAQRRDAERLSDCAVKALVAEALLTPKPALVDQRGSGAHRDLDLARLLSSAESLRDSFRSMALHASAACECLTLREQLGAIGRQGERCMLAATGGSNAHRGAIWVLGLLTAALAMHGTRRTLAGVAATAARLAALPDRHAPDEGSNGARACRRFGVRGARGEAAAGFPHVIQVGLPALRSARARGAAEQCARLDALMAIMARLDDTCLLHRGGWSAVVAAQRGARRVLARGGAASTAGQRALLALDADLLRRNASPGGCADLLAACLFLDDLHLQ